MQGQSNATPIQNPQRQIVESQNAGRVARRLSVQTLATQRGRASSVSLQRGFDPSVKGARLERLQDLPPETIQPQQQSFSEKDLKEFLSAFQFAPQKEVLARSSSGTTAPSSRFAPGTISSIIERSRQTRLIDPISGQPVSRRAKEGLFGGIIISPF
jgi:hypothetical protein